MTSRTEPAQQKADSGANHEHRVSPTGRVLRASLTHAVAGVIGVLVLYSLLVAQARSGHTGAETLMPSMGMADIATHHAFYLMQATGLAALLWAYAGLVLGLLVGGRLPWLRVRRSRLERLHRHLNVIVLALMLVHAIFSVYGTETGTWMIAFVPQAAAFEPLAYTTGIVSFYLAILLGLSWYAFHRFARRAWLLTHQFAALTYVLGLWHTLDLGADFRVIGSVRSATWVLQLPLLALFVWRLASPRRPGDRIVAAGQSARGTRVLAVCVLLGAAAAIGGIVALTVDAATRGT